MTLVACRRSANGIKTRDLCLLPYRVAIALQQAGWWLRSNIAWVKPEPGPENVRSRPICAHEAVFLFTKRQAGYHYDADAMREPYAPSSLKRFAVFLFRVTNEVALARRG